MKALTPKADFFMGPLSDRHLENPWCGQVSEHVPPSDVRNLPVVGLLCLLDAELVEKKLGWTHKGKQASSPVSDRGYFHNFSSLSVQLRFWRYCSSSFLFSLSSFP